MSFVWPFAASLSPCQLTLVSRVASAVGSWAQGGKHSEVSAAMSPMCEGT